MWQRRMIERFMIPPPGVSVTHVVLVGLPSLRSLSTAEAPLSSVAVRYWCVLLGL